MPNVFFDDEIFSLQIRGGISRYFTELFECLNVVPDIEPHLPFRLTCNLHLAASPSFNGHLFFRGTPIPGRRTLTRSLNYRATASALGRSSYDVVHATLYDERLLDRIGKAKLVITVHDMVPEIMPEAVGGLGERFSRAKRALIAEAAGVVAVSANTAADITRLTGRSPDSIRVIHHGVSERLRWHPRRGAAPALPERFILFVGHRRAYKNFNGAAAALAEVLRSEPGLALVCFGGGPFTAAERAPFEAAGVMRRVLSTEGDDQALASAYARATAFVFPSLYEGFGMPILEAMMNRCPVVLAERSCFPEIAQDAALYFDTGAIDGLVETLHRVVRDADLRRRLGEAGVRRATHFSWQRSASEHAALYRSLAP